MNGIATQFTPTTLSFDKQAVKGVLIWFENGEGWAGSVEYFVNGMKLERDFRKPGRDKYETLNELLEAMHEFLATPNL